MSSFPAFCTDLLTPSPAAPATLPPHPHPWVCSAVWAEGGAPWQLHGLLCAEGRHAPYSIQVPRRPPVSFDCAESHTISGSLALLPLLPPTTSPLPPAATSLSLLSCLLIVSRFHVPLDFPVQTSFRTSRFDFRSVGFGERDWIVLFVLIFDTGSLLLCSYGA